MQGVVASRNTQQALDWATKRRLQVERASRLRSERQVLLKADRLSATDFADDEPSEGTRLASAPIAGRRAQTGGYEDGFARSYSQPGGDLLMANGGGGANTQRPASEDPGRLGRRSHYGGVPDGVAEPQQRPEWAREMSVSARPSRFGDGYDGAGVGYDNGASAPDEGVRQERKSGRGITPPQPENWDWFRDEQDGRGGGYPRGLPPPVTSTKHEAAVAAAAARFPDDIPLTQSDGAIGFSRQRALPRAAQPQTQQQQQLAADFFGMDHTPSPEHAPPAAAAAFFGFDEKISEPPKTFESRRHGRPRQQVYPPPDLGGGEPQAPADALRLLPRRGNSRAGPAGAATLASRRPEWNGDAAPPAPAEWGVEYEDSHSAGDSEISAAPTAAAEPPAPAQRRASSRAPALQQPEWNSDNTGATNLLAQPPPRVPRRGSAGRRKSNQPDPDSEFARPLEEVVAPRKLAARGRRAEPGRPGWDSTPNLEHEGSREPSERGCDTPGNGNGRRPGSGGDKRPPSASRRVPSAARRRDAPQRGGGGGDGYGGGGDYGEYEEAPPRQDRNERPLGRAPDERGFGGRDERPAGGRDERPVGGGATEERPVGGRDERPLTRAPPPADDGTQTSLCQCEICGRSFAEDRLATHRVACEKSKSRVRKVFNGAKQRLQGLDNVNVKQGEKEALKAAERRKELMRPTGPAASSAASSSANRGGGGGGYGATYGESEDPPREERQPRKSVLGKNGRPLSPLSAAVARAKAGEDPFDEDPDLVPSDITPCPSCGRNFGTDRLHVHLAICQKVAVNSQSRKVWDSAKQRTSTGPGEWGGGSPAPSRVSTRKPSFPRGPPRRVSTGAPSSVAKSSDWGGGGGGGGGDVSASADSGAMPANKMPKWKRDHAAFQAALKAGRQISAAQAAGIPLSQLPPTATDPAHDDRIACPHCNRKFNQQAAERHIPKCTSITAKPKMLTRGGGGGIHNPQAPGGAFVPSAPGARSSVRF